MQTFLEERKRLPGGVWKEVISVQILIKPRLYIQRCLEIEESMRQFSPRDLVLPVNVMPFTVENRTVT